MQAEADFRIVSRIMKEPENELHSCNQREDCQMMRRTYHYM